MAKARCGRLGLPIEAEKFIHENVTELGLGQGEGINPILTHCACCGKEIYISVPKMWTYKIKLRKSNKDRITVYYDSYTCYMEGRRNLCNIVKAFIWK